VDTQLQNIYQSKQAQTLQRKSCSTDKHRQRLIKRAARTHRALMSSHPWPFLQPIRIHHLSTLRWQIERNRIKHRHKAVKTLLKAYLRTKLSDAYAFYGLDSKPPDN